jgi:hypothetical protein
MTHHAPQERAAIRVLLMLAGDSMFNETVARLFSFSDSVARAKLTRQDEGV